MTKEKKNYICTSKSTKTDTRQRTKNQTAFLTQAMDLTVWKLSGTRFQFPHRCFLENDNNGSKSWIQAAWEEQFSFVTAQPRMQHFSITKYNFSFHHGEQSKHLYFYCNRSYEDKQKGFLTWGDIRRFTNSTLQATTVELGVNLHFDGAAAACQVPWLAVPATWTGFLRNKGNGPWSQTKATAHELD